MIGRARIALIPVKIVARNHADTRLVAVASQQFRREAQEVVGRRTVVFEDNALACRVQKPRNRLRRRKAATAIRVKKARLKVARPIDGCDCRARSRNDLGFARPVGARAINGHKEPARFHGAKAVNLVFQPFGAVEANQQNGRAIEFSHGRAFQHDVRGRSPKLPLRARGRRTDEAQD